MNTKRQTIWLVSMLSLMVVLSAYYLFTEDADKLNTAVEKSVEQGIEVQTEVQDQEDQEQAVTGDLTSSTQSGDAESVEGTQEEAAKTDAQVLQQMASAKTGSERFADWAYKRNQAFSKQVNDLMDKIVDPKLSSEEASQATDELQKLENKQAKVENMEDLLTKTYKNAIVMEEGKKFKVVVQAEKLDRSQAQAIIDMMIKELNVAKDAVSVQYIH